MEKTINIDGQDIRFVSNGATMLRYKAIFNRGLFADENTLLTKASNNEMDDDAVEILYMLSYVLAKQGNPEIGTFEEFMERFEILSLLEKAPEIITLLTASSTPTVASKKK